MPEASELRGCLRPGSWAWRDTETSRIEPRNGGVCRKTPQFPAFLGKGKQGGLLGTLWYLLRTNRLLVSGCDLTKVQKCNTVFCSDLWAPRTP